MILAIGFAFSGVCGQLALNSFFCGGMTFEQKENSLVANVNLFNFSQSTLMFDLCTVKSGDDRHSALCHDICHAEI